MISWDQIEVITFDCYGTLVDWESGILAALAPFLEGAGVKITDDEILHTFARLESAAQEGIYAPYRHVLGRVMRGLAAEHGFTLEPDAWGMLAESVEDWPVFPDTVAALDRLRARYPLGVLSNIDDDLFAATLARLPGGFRWVVTAEEVVSYKPNARHFTFAEQRIGVPRERWLHVAQSLYHDIAPAKRFGLPTVWVNRRRGRDGFGATPPAAAVPDLEVASLAELADRAGVS
ncbi:MAG: haloacid dehalogenase type II [Gemmatimonadetes bacterium]|nr:haloacid dehalogenase type II [Gemmatimonadota bacterium]